MANKHYDIVVFGSGLAGLSLALRLRKKGKSVLVLEKNAIPGGKLQAFTNKGFQWDNGPSLFTEPHRIDELFELFNKDPRDYFNYSKIEESCRYFFDRKEPITLYGDKAKTFKLIKNRLGEQEANSYIDYLKSAKKDYASVGQLFLNGKKPRFLDYFTLKFIKLYGFFLSKKMRKSLNNHNEQQFKSEEMRLIFNRFGTYNGSNPYEMSGLYSMIASLELNHGTFFPKGGMKSIISSLYKLATEEGVEFSFNTQSTLTRKGNEFEIVSSGSTADIAVSAMDHLNFKKNVLGQKGRTTVKNLSTSGLVFYWGIDIEIPNFGLHNIIFNGKYEDEFNSLFGLNKNYQTPTIYVHVSSVVNEVDAPKKGMNLFVMINTSAYDSPTEEYILLMKKFVIKRIKQITQIDISQNIICEDYWDNKSIEEKTGSTSGALYGESSNALTSALKRHGNVDKHIPNLYYCGGTVHPGGGIPLVTRSAKIVSDLIQ